MFSTYYTSVWWDLLEERRVDVGECWSFEIIISRLKREVLLNRALQRVINDIQYNKCEAVPVMTYVRLSTQYTMLSFSIGFGIAMIFAKWFFVGLNHTLKIVLNALLPIRFFLDQDVCLMVSHKDRSPNRCYSHCISPLLKLSSLHTVLT